MVTLTTSPKRLPLLEPVLRSLVNQSVPPDEIHLNIPHAFRRTGERYDLPAWLANWSPVVRVHRLDDIGPATKNVPTIERFAKDDDVIIVTVDDDVRYLPRSIEVLVESVAAHPSAAFGLSGYDLGDSHENVYRSASGPIQILEGWAGWAAHRRALGDGVAAYFAACAPHRPCFLHDDLVMSNWLATNDVVRHRLIDPRANTRMMKRRGAQMAVGYESDALHRGAGGEASGLDPSGVMEALKKLGRWRVTAESQS
ncbi:MAG: glycosyltransferase family 2 protein [Phycisphaerae bacterium]|nr:glycosyltransferase family 2 protein [Phycisphaerae bacterium]